MARVRVQKTSFTAGEVSPWLLGRPDLRAYDNGAAIARNVVVHPAGGITRRPGLCYVDTAAGPSRLVTFEFNTQQVYLLVFSDKLLRIYREGVRIGEIAAPWSAEQITQFNWTQSADTLLVVHPDVPPKKLTRTQGEQWEISDWSFFTENNRIECPHYKFSDTNVTLQPNTTAGAITLTASAEVFVSEHVGVRFRVADKEVQVTGFVSASVVNADVKETLPNKNVTTDWTEQAFSSVRGWPVSVCFHQDRLVLGGSRDLPNLLWLSCSGDYFNFDLGEGLDDEAIEFSLLSDQVNAVRAVFSGRHLQVFTSGAEWMVTGDPLAPTNIQLNRQTRIGSRVDRTVPPRDVDGATLFIPRNGQQLREFLFTDTEQAYQATDLALLAHHLFADPLDMDFDRSGRLLHVVMSNGTMATLTVYREEEVSAWTLQETNGSFRAVCTVGEQTYVLVERAGGFLIEMFDERLQVDSSLIGNADDAKAVWSGLDHLEGQVVKVVADAAVHADCIVEAGAITLVDAANEVQAGLGFTHVIEPLPIAPSGMATGQGRKLRPISMTFRVRDTGAIRIDTGRNIVDIPFRRFGDEILDAPPPLYSGDKTIRTLGWIADGTSPLWRIEQDTPLPFTLLSVSIELSIND